MDLKWLLVRQITMVALACFCAGSALALYTTAREAGRQNQHLVELTSRQLDLQLSRIDRSTDIPKRFPDWNVVTSYALRPGQCVEFQGPDGSVQRSSCAGFDSTSIRAPKWFNNFYKFLTSDQLTGSRSVTYRGTHRGTIVVAYDPVAMAANAWSTIAPLLSLSAALIAVLCLVTYLVVGRALRPAKEILAGLNRLGRGDLTCRLPSFRLAELDRISEVFNTLSEELSKATSDRAELARRLVDAQEQERRHIARELHDEIAQKLAAFNALAASIRTSAQNDAPVLVEEAKKLEEMASGLMKSVRLTLTYLRPQEIDDLGLIQSLRALVEQHNRSALGRTKYSIETDGDVENLRAETSAHVYRIIQEALTNASKHANARMVKVLLSRVGGNGQEGVRLSVIDDGTGPMHDERTSLAGSGLIGMRERVFALSGKFTAGPLPSGGFGLQVEFSTLQQGA
ncbi:HAMP domain-containing protein [Filomicrobium insigne]|uniref:HAMP domain-containing protein n=1 Tax=Filomicrobium insigne TaxID=418854 RepID=A0A1H0S888_9HYPH|nr:histidine kinase [Filomicrobium insigne]SDP37982.1 HAMP domain-containing protein [Filomicrobium insigne]